MTVQEFFRLVEEQGSLYDVDRYRGIMPEQIDDPELAALWDAYTDQVVALNTLGQIIMSRRPEGG